MGRLLTGANALNQRDIWIAPTSGGAPIDIHQPPGRRLSSGVQLPDGRSLAFASDRTGGLHIWVGAVSGGQAAGEPRQVTFGSSIDQDQAPAWRARRDAHRLRHAEQQPRLGGAQRDRQRPVARLSQFPGPPARVVYAGMGRPACSLSAASSISRLSAFAWSMRRPSGRCPSIPPIVLGENSDYRSISTSPQTDAGWCSAPKSIVSVTCGCSRLNAPSEPAGRGTRRRTRINQGASGRHVMAKKTTARTEQEDWADSAWIRTQPDSRVRDRRGLEGCRLPGRHYPVC